MKIDAAADVCLCNQRMQVAQNFIELFVQFLMTRFMADDTGRARNVKMRNPFPALHHAARKCRTRRTILFRITVRGNLARILARFPRRARGQKIQRDVACLRANHRSRREFPCILDLMLVQRTLTPHAKTLITI